MYKKNSQQGFSVLEILIVVGVLAALAWVGYTAWTGYHKSKDQSQSGGQSQSKSESKSQTETWQKGAAAVRGKYADACVVKVNDTTWRMYYGVQPEGMGGQLNIYSSSSTDGKTWTQDAGTRKTMATFPEVIKLPDGRWRMYFQAAGAIKSAISADGLSFADESGARVDALATENPAVENAAAPAVLRQDNGTYVLLYRASLNGAGRYYEKAPNPETNVLMWATSTDGLAFTKKGIAIDTRNSTLDGQLDGPTFVKWDDGKVRIYATSYGGVFKFDFDGSSFGSATLAYAGDAKKDAMGYNGAPPGDPTLAKIGGTWYMYHGGGPEDPGIHYATLK